MRTSGGNSSDLSGLSYTAMMSSSNKRAARWAMSMCPKWIGSKVPGNTARTIRHLFQCLANIAFSTPCMLQGRCQQGMLGGGELGIGGKNCLRFAAGLLDQAHIGQVGKLQLGITGLAGAQELPRPALFQVFLCQHKPVIGGCHHLQAF